MPDKRLNKRLEQILLQLNGKMEQSIPSAIGDRGQSKAYYRFINNEAVAVSALLQSGRQQVLQAASQQKVVLAIQDTTELDFTGKRSARELGCLSYAYQKGMFLHNHLLLTEQGEAMGLLDQAFFQRDASKLGGSRKNRYQPIEHKESFRWLEQFNQLQVCFKEQTHQQVIQICDREADIHELLQARTTTHIHYIIRSSRDRKRQPKQNESEDSFQQDHSQALTSSIWQHISGKESQFSYQLQVDHPQHGKRVAHLQVRYGQVVIKPGYRPKQQGQLSTVKLWLVETLEVGPPEGVEPLCWRLLTSLEVEDEQIARQIICYYTYRWRIERFHYLLKQGAQVEKLQVAQVEAVKKAVILYSWIALKVLQTQHWLHNQPQAPISSIGLSQLDYLIVYQYLKSKATKLAAKSLEPTLSEWAALLAQLLGSKLAKDHSIGVVTLWRAYHKFLLIREAYFAFKDVGKQ